MRGLEKPYIERLFFENFFIEEVKFDASKWKQFDKESFTRMQISIAQNIYHIMNTTNTLKTEEYLNTKLRFYNFGVPDFATLYQSNNINTDVIEQCVIHAIQSFEPRLTEIRVKTENGNGKTVITVEGKIKRSDPEYFQIVYYNLK